MSQGLFVHDCSYIVFLHFSLLVSMAPLSNEIRPVTSCCPPHIGPAVPEVNSVWFKLFIYDQVKSGPPSLLLVKGTRLTWLPKIFEVGKVKGEVCIRAKWLTRLALISSSWKMKQVGEFLLPSGLARVARHWRGGKGSKWAMEDHWDANPSQDYPPTLNLLAPIYTPGWREALWE